MRSQAIAVLAAAGTLLLGGCAGQAGDPQVATAGGAETTEPTKPAGDEPVVDEQDRMRQFARCMREHGVDVPDPDPNGDGPKIRVGAGAEVDKDKVRPALEACRSLLPNGGERRELSPEDLEKMRQMAQCMREHGVDVPDPNPDQPGILIERKAGDGKPAADEDLQRALEACRHLGPKRDAGR